MSIPKLSNPDELPLTVIKNEQPNSKNFPLSISVSCVIGERALAVASADRLSRRVWNVSRVFVPDGYRSQGVGGLLLERLKLELSRVPQFKQLSVAAGGYNSPIERLERFYLRHGFEKEEEAYYVWRKKRTEATVPRTRTGTFTRT